MVGMTFSDRNWMQRYGWGQILTVVVLFSLWQIVAPYVLNFAAEQMAMRNAVIFGLLLVLLAALGFYGNRPLELCDGAHIMGWWRSPGCGC